MDELYVFGYGNNKQFPSSLDPRPGQPPNHLRVKNLSVPTCALRAQSIKVLWASWCDLILLVDDKTFHFYGTSLIAPQIAAIEDLSHVPGRNTTFFGRRDTLGVLGFTLPDQRSLTVLHTAEEVFQGADPITTYSLDNSIFDILDVQFTAGQSVLVNVRTHPGQTPERGMMVELPSLKQLENMLKAGAFDRIENTSLPSFRHLQRLDFSPVQCCTNTATFTAIDDEGRVYTYATDRRFSGAIGRDLDTGNDSLAWERAQPIPFLEESVVKKVAAGGLYTAGFSDDGELCIWGQSTSDMPNELLAIRHRDEAGDEYIRTPELRIDGQVARTTDVAVGAAYLLVAVECEGVGSVTQRGVFAAGSNRNGALGLGPEMDGGAFVEDFVPVEALGGKRVKQMICAGMSSYVVAAKEAP